MKALSLSVPWTLFFIFLILKLTEEINWSWLWITSPIWIPLGGGLLIWSLSMLGLFILDKTGK